MDNGNRWQTSHVGVPGTCTTTSTPWQPPQRDQASTSHLVENRGRHKTSKMLGDTTIKTHVIQTVVTLVNKTQPTKKHGKHTTTHKSNEKTQHKTPYRQTLHRKHENKQWQKTRASDAVHTNKKSAKKTCTREQSHGKHTQRRKFKGNPHEPAHTPYPAWRT